MKSIYLEELETIFSTPTESFLDGDKSISLESFTITDHELILVFVSTAQLEYDFSFNITDLRITVDKNNVMITDSEGNEKVCRFSVYNLVPAEL
jgi:hypothetical protein